MTTSVSQLDLIEVFRELSGIPLRESDQAGALSAVAHLGKKVLNSQVCTITFVDLQARTLHQVACAGHDAEFDKRWTNKVISIGSREEGSYLDYELIAKGEPIEAYELQLDGKGVARPTTAIKYGLNSLLAYPLKSDGRILGYLNHFSSQPGPFTSDEKDLIRLFGEHAVISIEWLRRQSAREAALGILNKISADLTSSSPSQFLDGVAQGVCNLLSVPTCIVWELDKSHNRRRLRVAATANVPDDYRDFTLDPNEPELRTRLHTRQAVQILDVCAEGALYVGKELATKNGWVSLLTVPIFEGNEPSGMIDAYTSSPRYFEKLEMEAFTLFATETALALLQLERRVEEMNTIIQEVTEVKSENELFEVTLRKALELVGCDHGSISRLNVVKGELELVRWTPEPDVHTKLKVGEGVSGAALESEEPFRADDVSKEPCYREMWHDTRSELAVPLLIQNAEVRQGKEVHHGSKRLGVLNVESDKFGAFFALDEDRLLMLARAASSVLERLETDRRFARLNQLERKILDNQSLVFPIESILQAISETLGFEFVNVSLIDEERTRIKSLHVYGLDPNQEKSFKLEADHPLHPSPGATPDIQADIVAKREVEVPDKNDKRFDPNIFKKYGHENLIRVFLPIISPIGNRVLGTLEAGYRRDFRPFIYESDIRLLTEFVECITLVLEQKRVAIRAWIMHEFRAPTAAIRGHISLLLRRFQILSPAEIQDKLRDISRSSDAILVQVFNFEESLRASDKPPLPRKPVKTKVMSEVVFATLNELKQSVEESGYDPKNVHYDHRDTSRIVLWLDPGELKRVAYNLIINAIKYAELDPASFRIEVAVHETPDLYVVKFKDNGIGITVEASRRIFEEGYRAPEAVSRFVSGSGLGLTIARKIMRDMGGDLILSRIRKPTEFHIILPKKLQRRPR